MKCLHLFVILILLILVIYYHNQNMVYQKFEHFDDNIINQIASIINKDKITLNNVDINGTLAVNNIKCLGGDQRVHVHNTLKVDGGNLDVPNTLSVNNINKLDKNDIKILAPISANGITTPKITTYDIYSTNGEGSWLDLHANIHGYKEFHSDGAIIGKGTVQSNGLLTARDIKTRFLQSTGESGNYINFNCGLYSPKETIIGADKNSNRLMIEQDGKRTRMYKGKSDLTS